MTFHQNQMQKLKIEKEEVKSKLERDFTCSICLEIYKKPQTLKCKHIFCSKCLDNWFRSSTPTCPICRKKIMPNDPALCASMEENIKAMRKFIKSPNRRVTLGSVPYPVVKRPVPEKDDRPRWRY